MEGPRFTQAPLRQTRALHVEQAHFETLFDNAPDAVVVLDGDDRVLRVNRSFTSLFGYEPADAVGRPINDLIVPSRLAEEGAALSARALAGKVDQTETKRRRRDGTELDVAITVNPVELDGHRVAVHATYRNITEQKSLNRRRQLAVSLLEATLESAADGILVVDAEGQHIRRANRRFAEMLRLPGGVVRSGKTREVLGPIVQQLRNADEFSAEIRRSLGEPTTERVCLMHFSDGRVYEHYLRPQTIDGRVVGRVISLRDITARHHAEAKQLALTRQLNAANAHLRELVDHDPLTHLLNRRGLEHVLKSEQSRSTRAGTPVLALLLDCDDFKRINDELGYQMGDAMLREAAAAIRSSVRPSDQVARLGGDEFLVLLPDTGYWEGLRLAERIRLEVSRRSRTLSESCVLTVSAGVCAVPPGRVSLEELLALAYVALRSSKAAGKNQVAGRGTDGLDPDRCARQLTSMDTYRVVAQPIVGLGDDEPVGHELLSRTIIEGLEGPDHFFPLAQHHRMLTLVDLLCLESCIRHAAGSGLPGLHHVNVFPSTVMNTPVERLVTALNDTSPSEVCLEITEQQFFGDSQQFRHRVQALREAGFRVALDDVGFGRTSLELLMLLEVDQVKIDRRFVSGIGVDPTRTQALRRLLAVIETIGAVAVAEGIETQEERDVLADIGVQYGQGFFWGHPRGLALPEAAATGARHARPRASA